jgi:hypothetical protein
VNKVAAATTEEAEQPKDYKYDDDKFEQDYSPGGTPV